MIPFCLRAGVKKMEVATDFMVELALLSGDFGWCGGGVAADLRSPV
ncbi:hypothetical protein [Boudabousia marimammalium]|nr:hypothetical protein [Boudabousia marimammalium]